MNIHDDMSDDDVLRAAATSLSALPVAGPPAAEAIMARGRARRRRTVTGLGLAGTAGVAVLALGLAGVFGGHSPARTGTTIRTAAFTLAKDGNGTATLKLTQDQMFDPGALQQALGQDGIPALVKIDTYCSSNPAPPSPHSIGVLSVQLPDGTPVGTSTPGHQQPVPADAVTVINPAAMPAGTELFFDYVNSARDLIGGLVYTNSYTCSSGLPSGGAG
ncbi:MAG: hypothetical protein ACLPUO_22250 [Streptosporangiaceae bacterium]|jgi:hypothetical protein